MKKSSQKMEIEKRIGFLETQQKNDIIALKNQLEYSYQKMQPTHYISNFIQDTFLQPNALKSSIIKTLASGAGSWVIKKILVGKNKSISKKILGSLIQLFSYKILNNYINK